MVTARTVDWGQGEAGREGLRERKKRLLRQQLSDTATEMFLERGFDAFRVTEVAAACGVSEKTVYNYFPTKESLVLDRDDATMAALRAGLADPSVPPVEATLRILDGQLRTMMAWLADQEDFARAGAAMLRFGRLIRATPSLRAHQRDMTDRLVEAVAEMLAGRSGLSADAPEPQIAGTALIGLWDVHARSLQRHLDGGRSPGEITLAVTEDVHRAGRLLEAGLGQLATPR